MDPRSFRRPAALLRPFALAIMLATVPAAAALRADDAKNADADRKAMQGDWVSKDEQGESTWTFKNDHLSLKTPSRAY